jgi:predicted oxidoreductase
MTTTNDFWFPWPRQQLLRDDVEHKIARFPDVKASCRLDERGCGFSITNQFIYMRTINIGNSPLLSSRLAYGCWRVAGGWNPTKITAESKAAGCRAMMTAYELGFTLFDNAAIYCAGEAERLLGAVLSQVSGMRDHVLVATKCGIRIPGDPTPEAPARYDFSAEHIINSCEQSLRRLGIETIDLFMLHRPDFLADPVEIAGAFAKLQAAGKVRYFGVSNFRPTLVQALQAACPMPLLVNQVEISLAKLDAFTDGTLDQCLTTKMTPMAWSPLAAGLIGAGATRLLPAQKAYQPEKFLGELSSIAQSHGVDRTTVALAWLLKHPSGIMPIIGTINPGRIHECAKADEMELTREEWYRLLIAARGEPLP